MVKKYLNIFFLFVIFTKLFNACGEDSSSKEIRLRSSEEFNRMSSQEQIKAAPNDLFRSIFDNDYEAFQNELGSDHFDITPKNENNNTVLAVAIQLNRTDMALELIEHLNDEDLFIKNFEGRSYLSFAAEADEIQIFDLLIKKYNDSKNFMDKIRTYFREMDFADEKGRRAAFFAKSRYVISQLHTNWFKKSYGSFEGPYNLFFFDYDENGNTWMHEAAKFQRVSVINWYVQERCQREEAKGFPGMVSNLVRGSRDIAQTTVLRNRFINIRNKDGNTALHIAAIHGNDLSIRSLLGCTAFITPIIKNDERRIPMTSLLAELANSSAQEQKVLDSYRSSFEALFGETTNLYIAGNLTNYDFKSRIDDQDTYGKTMLHYADLLKDRYFYERLQKYSPKLIFDNNGLSTR